jgi:hypothetical protein
MPQGLEPGLARTQGYHQRVGTREEDNALYPTPFYSVYSVPGLLSECE